MRPDRGRINTITALLQRSCGRVTSSALLRQCRGRVKTSSGSAVAGGHYRKRGSRARPQRHRAKFCARSLIESQPELLRDSAWFRHPSDLWAEFLSEMCGSDYEYPFVEVPSAAEIIAGFKGWAVGRYNVVLTRGEVIDALGEEWRTVGGKICDAELHYLVWKMPASRRRRRRAE